MKFNILVVDDSELVHRLISNYIASSDFWDDEIYLHSCYGFEEFNWS